jgi:hypothetical protein
MEQPRELIILDSVTAARAFLRCRPSAEVELLSTHYSVVDFLESRGIVCRDCSDLLSTEQVRTALHSACRELDTVLRELDDTLGARMCAAAGLPRMRLFYASFKYVGQYHLAGLRSFERILTSRLALGDVGAVRFFHALGSSTDPVFSFVESAERCCRKLGVNYTDRAIGRPLARSVGRRLRRLLTLVLREMTTSGRLLPTLREKLRLAPSSRAAQSAPLVLLLASKQGSFFARALKGTRVRLKNHADDSIGRRWPAASAASRIVEQMAAEAAAWLEKNSGAHEGLETALVVQVVSAARGLFCALADAFLATHSEPASAVAWDVPPVTSARSNLLVEFYLCSGVPVWGRQHGANYLCQDLGTIHFDSDFNRCTHYFSYGAGAQEFAALYPKRGARCAFIAAGHVPLEVRHRRRPVDIVFPITNCCSLFDLARGPESELAQRQAAILGTMDGRSDLRCVVKPFLHFSEDDFAHTQALRRLRNVRVVRTTWADYLAQWRPRLAVFEIASTPLYEVLPLDMDIFLMLDPVFPFAESALAMLRDRVHVFATLRELTDAIRTYGREPLPRLRDSKFYATYANRGSPSAVAALLTEPAWQRECRLPIP